MNNTIYTSLDIKNNEVFTPISIAQGDRGSLIQFNITCNGEPQDISNTTPIFQMSKNGIDITKNCTLQNNKVILNISEDITNTPGRFPYQICLLSDDVKITTVTNYIEVRKGGG